MASCKVIRRLALLHHARGLCYKQDVVHQPRSSMQLLAALEEHISSSGKELLAGLKDAVSWEKEMLLKDVVLSKEKEKLLNDVLSSKEMLLRLLREQRTIDRVNLLSLKGRNHTGGLFEQMEEVLAFRAGTPAKKGSHLWEAILSADPTLRLCIEKYTNITAKDVVKQAANCSTIYNVLSQHMHAGKELAQLQVANGKIMFHRGPMSVEQVQVFLCIGQAANFDIEEDPSTRNKHDL